ncbi:TetR/AcrR family transcriptional regulator [Modestobacter marinus]|uniref:AcrR family transcriptional regulator n=1 Tax=Modestobacter marinus TaxID=477641 RepID=A0A846LU34_9ACTN|nr:TetR/AcrR family transcriptional regulator [Modestobacter marinus]NIH69155.1 AcrR family transcriptional regulator [Modestobacter marinus]GGL77147.1 TetR family transcriptional regulator [Modestobacter marinus]
MAERIEGLRLPRTQRRQQILAAAAQAFAETGFHGTSLADVATRVGVSQPGLLHHYPNKQALILAVLEERDEVQTHYLDELFRGQDPSVVDWLTALCARNVEQPELVRLYTVTAAESLDPAHPAHEYFQNRYQRIRGVIARRIVLDQEKGRFAPTVDPEGLASELIALMDGLQLQWLMQPPVDMCRLLEASLQRLAAGPDGAVGAVRQGGARRDG